jgi:hypothetical protein
MRMKSTIAVRGFGARAWAPRLAPWLRGLTLIATVGILIGSFGCTPVGTPGTNPSPGTDPVPGPTPTSGPMAADVVILDDPTGGTGVTDLACTFEMTQLGTDGNEPIQVRVDWSASCGTHKSETFTFRGSDEAFTSTYEDPTGMPISMTFWATIHWTDSRGMHVLRSASAACTY